MKKITLTLALLAAALAASGQVLYTNMLTNFWSTNGSSVSFQAAGNAACGSTNTVLRITLGTNVLFSSLPTRGTGAVFTVAGTLRYDRTNMICVVQYAADDPVHKTQGSSSIITNLDITSPPFAIIEQDGHTNLTLSSGQILASVAVPPLTTSALLYIVAPPGGGGGATIVFTNTQTLAPGSSAFVTNFGGVAGVFQVGIPAGAPGSNTVTVYNLTNSWLGSQQYTTYATNAAFWHASNFLARVAGISDWNVQGGDDGQNPPFPIPFHLVGSISGSNGWFTLTNGFQTSSNISIAVITNGLSVNGLPAVNPGFATLYSVDHFELIGRTNYGFGQHYRFASPQNNSDAATKGYADNIVANAFNNNFGTRVDTNGWNHFSYSYQNLPEFDLASHLGYIPIAGFTTGGGINDPNDGHFIPTNCVLTVALADLTAGWQLQSSTNLALVAGFSAFTSYTAATNAGVVSFTVAVDPTVPAVFFRVVGNVTAAASFSVPLAMNAGANWPSNTWNLQAVTNGLMPGTIFQANSNAVGLWTGKMNAGSVTWLQHVP